MTEDLDSDVLVIGAGFAGAAAAAELAGQGLKVTILEARSRVGGRAYSRGFAESGEIVEFGGSWITPWQQRIRRHAAQNGIELRERHPVVERRYHDGLQLRNEPAEKPARPAYERTMARIRADTVAYEAGDRSKASLSLDRYLDSIAASPEANIQVKAWWTISGNGRHDRVSAAEFLSSCAYGKGHPEGMLDKLQHGLAPGASLLVERMIARSGARLMLDCQVRAIDQSGSAIAVTTIGGRRFAAPFAICCLPLNLLATIAFTPALPPRQAEAAKLGHLGASVKVWIKARGIRPGILATGGGSGLQWMLGERESGDGAALLVAFGLADGGFDPQRKADIAEALGRFFPEAELVAWDWHDWVGDPHARGTWVALPADALWVADSELWAPHGHVFFAGSDIAAEAPGWFEAAISSGEAAAQAVAKRLERQKTL